MKKRGFQYDRANIPRAYEATQAGMTVYKAARLYNVPESTLRDRTRGNVAVDAKKWNWDTHVNRGRAEIGGAY